MPVESGVAPAGPSATDVPVPAPSGGSFGTPSFGFAADLRGALPLLPAPVPGLLGPALNFVGNAPEAAAAYPEAGAAQIAPAPEAARQGRAADKTPALPANPFPGAPSIAISLDRKSAAAAPGNGLSLSRSRADEASSNPLVEPTALEHARPEKAAGLGRRFFDQGNEKDRGALEDGADTRPGSSVRPSPIIAATIPEGGAFGLGYGAKDYLSPRHAGAAFGVGHGPSPIPVSYAPEGESLRDAVASVPGYVAPGAGAVSFFRSASPNGKLSASAGAAVFPVLGAPRPLALDLSRSGLIVRVRAALNGVISPAPPEAAVARLAAPGPSTGLLERGAMLEAFSVSSNYANSIPIGQSLKAGASRAAVPFAPSAPASDLSAVPLWWAWLALPLFAAAIRSIR